MGALLKREDPWLGEGTLLRPLSIHQQTRIDFQFFKESWPTHAITQYGVRNGQRTQEDEWKKEPGGVKYRHGDEWGNAGIVYNLGHNLPVVNDEYGYMGEPKDRTAGDVPLTRAKHRQIIWGIYTAGGYGSAGDKYEYKRQLVPRQRAHGGKRGAMMFFSNQQTSRTMLIVALWSLLSQAAWAQTNKSIYFPPPGEGLDKQHLRQPEAVRLKPAVIAQLKGTATRWALWRNGYLVHVEGNFNQKEDVYSLRKTWHALTVGAAIKQGRIPSIKQPLSVWEKDLTGNDARATWQHVLTQSAGFDYPYGKHPDYAPGEMWTYSDHNLRRLTNALAKVYGKGHMYDRYDDVLKAAYFDAIGMRGWFTSKHAEDDGPRLNLDIEDLGRLGLLVLARGQWQGKEIIPRGFIEQLETKQTGGMKINYDGPNDGRPSLLYGHEDKFPEAPYGYLTWVNTDGDVHPKADRAWAWGAGRGGHMVFWNHRLGIVFACHGRKAEAIIPQIIEANLAATVKE